MNQATLPSRFLATLILVALLAACSSPPPPAEEAPAADAPTVADESTAAEESADAASADDYRAQREQCTWGNPCWPAVVDTVPASFSEAPMLAEMVAAGELPPVEERLPAEPLVIEPAEMIGQYRRSLLLSTGYTPLLHLRPLG